MVSTRKACLEKIRGVRLDSDRQLVEQGLGHSGEFDDTASGPHKDIDFWASSDDRQSVSDHFADLGALQLASCNESVWLNHDVYLLMCSDGVLLVDIKFGDLMVGPLILLGEEQLLDAVNKNNRLTGAAHIADVLLRRAARNKPLDRAHIESARAAWAEMAIEERMVAMDEFAWRVGRKAARSTRDVLEGRAPATPIAAALKWRKLRSVLQSVATARTATAKTLSIAAGKLTRRPRPFGHCPAGTLVVISGTDGTGKSTTLENVTDELRQLGLRCREAYLGRGRGNLRSVAALRDAVGRKVLEGDSANDVYRMPILNKLASWLYAFEYFIRTLKLRFYSRVLGYVVVCDRYCYDIALIRGASSSAMSFARAICPRPELNVLLTAPPDVILSRKKERDESEIERQQAALAKIIDGQYARCVSLSVDTGATDASATCRQIIDSIVVLSHRHWRR